MSLYLWIRHWGFIALLGICAILLCVLLVKFLITSIKEQRVADYMASIGYKRYLIDRCIITGTEIWAYAREGSEYVDEDELFVMSLKEVKERFK